MEKKDFSPGHFHQLIFQALRTFPSEAHIKIHEYLIRKGIEVEESNAFQLAWSKAILQEKAFKKKKDKNTNVLFTSEDNDERLYNFINNFFAIIIESNPFINEIENVSNSIYKSSLKLKDTLKKNKKSDNATLSMNNIYEEDIDSNSEELNEATESLNILEEEYDPRLEELLEEKKKEAKEILNSFFQLEKELFSFNYQTHKLLVKSQEEEEEDIKSLINIQDHYSKIGYHWKKTNGNITSSPSFSLLPSQFSTLSPPKYRIGTIYKKSSGSKFLNLPPYIISEDCLGVELVNLPPLSSTITSTSTLTSSYLWSTYSALIEFLPCKSLLLFPRPLEILYSQQTSTPSSNSSSSLIGGISSSSTIFLYENPPLTPLTNLINSPSKLSRFSSLLRLKPNLLSLWIGQFSLAIRYLHSIQSSYLLASNPLFMCINYSSIFFDSKNKGKKQDNSNQIYITRDGLLMIGEIAFIESDQEDLSNSDLLQDTVNLENIEEYKENSFNVNKFLVFFVEFFSELLSVSRWVDLYLKPVNDLNKLGNSLENPQYYFEEMNNSLLDDDYFDHSSYLDSSIQLGNNNEENEVDIKNKVMFSPSIPNVRQYYLINKSVKEPFSSHSLSISSTLSIRLHLPQTIEALTLSNYSSSISPNLTSASSLLEEEFNILKIVFRVVNEEASNEADNILNQYNINNEVEEKEEEFNVVFSSQERVVLENSCLKFVAYLTNSFFSTYPKHTNTNLENSAHSVSNYFYDNSTGLVLQIISKKKPCVVYIEGQLILLSTSDNIPKKKNFLFQERIHIFSTPLLEKSFNTKNSSKSIDTLELIEFIESLEQYHDHRLCDTLLQNNIVSFFINYVQPSKHENREEQGKIEDLLMKVPSEWGDLLKTLDYSSFIKS